METIEQKLDFSKPWNKPDIYLFTGNSTITNRGNLVMGRGAALECKKQFPGIDGKLAETIKSPRNQLFPDYYVLFCNITESQILGVFQVKRYYGDKADIKLIEKSTNSLAAIAKNKSDLKFHMNFPGIGFGNLAYSTVLPIVKNLPDNVFLYIMDHAQIR